MFNLPLTALRQILLYLPRVEDFAATCSAAMRLSQQAAIAEYNSVSKLPTGCNVAYRLSNLLRFYAWLVAASVLGGPEYTLFSAAAEHFRNAPRLDRPGRICRKYCKHFDGSVLPKLRREGVLLLSDTQGSKPRLTAGNWIASGTEQTRGAGTQDGPRLTPGPHAEDGSPTSLVRRRVFEYLAKIVRGPAAWECAAGPTPSAGRELAFDRMLAECGPHFSREHPAHSIVRYLVYTESSSDKTLQLFLSAVGLDELEPKWAASALYRFALSKVGMGALAIRKMVAFRGVSGTALANSGTEPPEAAQMVPPRAAWIENALTSPHLCVPLSGRYISHEDITAAVQAANENGAPELAQFLAAAWAACNAKLHYARAVFVWLGGRNVPWLFPVRAATLTGSGCRILHYSEFDGEIHYIDRRGELRSLINTGPEMRFN